MLKYVEILEIMATHGNVYWDILGRFVGFADLCCVFSGQMVNHTHTHAHIDTHTHRTSHTYHTCMCVYSVYIYIVCVCVHVYSYIILYIHTHAISVRVIIGAFEMAVGCRLGGILSGFSLCSKRF